MQVSLEYSFHPGKTESGKKTVVGRIKPAARKPASKGAAKPAAKKAPAKKPPAKK